MRRFAALVSVVFVGCAARPQAAASRATVEPQACEAPVGFTTTRGGIGGSIVRVTSLAANGEGSLASALAQRGARIVVFEVGGVIDLEGRSLDIFEPNLTIAGQTAPSPGITLVRGGIEVHTHDVVIQHLRVRPGEAGREKQSGWEVDGITTGKGAADVIVDHCSLSWATDENLTASGPRFDGATPDAWRASTSHRITFSNNIVAEGLSLSTHRKGEHSKGTLVHDNVTDVALVRNLYLSNVERSPYFKGGARGVVVNNWVVNPSHYAMKYALNADEWGDHPPQTGAMSVVANVFEYGPDTPAATALLFVDGVGACQLYLNGNLALDRNRQTVPLVSGKSQLLSLQMQPLSWPATLRALPATDVKAFISRNAGARPWDRDATDRRVMRDALSARGKIVNSESEVEGYPQVAATRAPFVAEEWNLACVSAQRRLTPTTH
ncbi:MAG: pectate lyase family protein [Myxococcota bacterium]